MKTILSVLFVSVLAGSFAYPPSSKVADKDVLARQKVLFELLQHPYQPGVSIYNRPEYLDIVKSYSIESNLNLYTNVEAVKDFVLFYKKGLIPYNELFSIYVEKHSRQAIALFHVFYYAKGKILYSIVTNQRWQNRDSDTYFLIL